MPKIPFRLRFMLVMAFVWMAVGSELFTRCTKDGKVNIFTVQDEIDLGLQVKAEIEADPAQYPILPRGQYAEAYGHLDRITNSILNSGKLSYKDEFVWEVNIINDDNTLNAFCAPGGYIYVYTGLIKFLDNEAQFAGVMGHEIAHADRRHVTNSMTKQYGVATLLSVIAGDNQGLLTEIAGGLIGLGFSRDHENDADAMSVEYLCGTKYQSNGAAGFFQKLKDSGQSGGIPAFLSTHPDDDKRIERINTKAAELACAPGGTFDAEYAAFKASLP